MALNIVSFYSTPFDTFYQWLGLNIYFIWLETHILFLIDENIPYIGMSYNIRFYKK